MSDEVESGHDGILMCVCDGMCVCGWVGGGGGVDGACVYVSGDHGRACENKNKENKDRKEKKKKKKMTKERIEVKVEIKGVWGGRGGIMYVCETNNDKNKNKNKDRKKKRRNRSNKDEREGQK